MFQGCNFTLCSASDAVAALAFRLQGFSSSTPSIAATYTTKVQSGKMGEGEQS